MAEPAGSWIGPYRLIGPIGSGGFSTVYRARDERLDCDVAIKVLAENHSLDPEIRERFLTEAQLLRVVDSPHVVRVYDLGETARHQPYLVLEYAARGTLRERVAARRRNGWSPSGDDVARVAGALAEGLAAIHAHNLIHRDVSPGNLLVRVTDQASMLPASALLGADERLVLADLGYAKDLRAHSGLTVGGGTHGFNAPEQRTLGRVDRRADVYAASALLAWLVTGAEPAPSGEGDPTTALLGRGVSAPLAVALGAGLAPAAQSRPADMAHWRAAVDAALGPPVTDKTRSSLPSAPATTRPRFRRASSIGAALALVVGLAGGLLAARARGAPSNAAEVTHLADGRVRVARADGPLAVAIFGPETATVGTTATFEAGIVAAVSYRWITPDGQHHPAVATVDVSFGSVGPADVVLSATGADGRQVTVTRRLQITG